MTRRIHRTGRNSLVVSDGAVRRPTGASVWRAGLARGVHLRGSLEPERALTVRSVLHKGLRLMADGP